MTDKDLPQVERQKLAFVALRGERDYQHRKWPGHTHTVGEWLVIMQKCLDDAKCAFTLSSDTMATLHEVRQVAAVGLACMEEHGSPHRGDPVTSPDNELGLGI